MPHGSRKAGSDEPPDLRAYRRKRDLGATPEPPGEDREREVGALPPGAAREFVIQQHAARAMHWDLRLEIDGVLASWAIPRGPSLDPADRRLAVQTEDHPLEYAEFEGIIPQGNYGAGAMIVWDRGSYHTVDSLDPARGRAEGKLDLILEGFKLRGRFALVRTARGEGREWLWICKRALAGQDETLDSCSVLSGLTVEQLRDGVSSGPRVLERARELGRPRPIPRERLSPMLARVLDEPFSRPGWLFEVKYDGMRVLAVRERERVRLRSRSGHDVSLLFPEVERALRALPLESFVLDGEVVALDADGRSSFERLQQRLNPSEPRAAARARIEVPAHYCVFDLLEVGGIDLRDCPLRERKGLLRQALPRIGPAHFVDDVEEQGSALFELAERHHVEGIVAKRASSAYVCGARSGDWLKIKVRRRGRLVVVGYQSGQGSRERLGSLLLGWRRDDALRYAGRVGSGLDATTIDAWLPRLQEDVQAEPAVHGVPDDVRTRATWVRPRYVVHVRYGDVTTAGVLRHPVFEGFVPDENPEVCHAPTDPEALIQTAPAPVPERDRRRISNRDKVFFPADGYTKGDLVAYYEAVWPWLEPYLKDRPLVLTRYPDGIDGSHFFQKNAPEWTPDWVGRVAVDGTDHFLCNDLDSLVYVINSAAIPLHVSSARVTDLDHPDWVVLDLDPKGAPWESVLRIARHIRALLDDLACPSFPKTSGQEGLHVLIPLDGTLDHDQARRLAEALARVVSTELPELATTVRPVAARGTRVYVDYLQNGRGKLIVAPFSVRPRPGAPVSTPLRWGQVTARLKPERLTLKTIVPRMRRDGDPMSELRTSRAPIRAVLDALAARLSAP